MISPTRKGAHPERWQTDPAPRLIDGWTRDAGVLMARMFELNGMAVFSAFEITALAAVYPTASDDDVARGAPTFAQVGKNGKQVMTIGGVFPNYVHPEVRKHFFTDYCVSRNRVR